MTSEHALATRGVFAVSDRHLTPELVTKVQETLPEPIRALWPAPGTHPGRTRS